MLRIQVNKRDAVPSYRSLGTSTTITASFFDGKVGLSGFGLGGMSVGDRIRLVRKDCKGNVAFIDTTTIAEISGGTIMLNPLPDIKLEGAEIKLNISKVPNGSLFNALEISGRHCYIDNPEGCGIDIKENILGKYTDYDKNKRRCVNDYILYDSCFLYQAAGITSANKYVFPGPSAMKNSKVRVKLLNDIVYKEYTGRRGTNWEAGGGFIWLNNCVVPVNGEGMNVMDRILWEGSVLTGPVGMAMPNEDGVYENGTTFFACENERYYTISGSTVTLMPNVEVFFEENCIRVSGVLEENFDVNLFQRDAIEKKFFFEKNKVIDFEKQIFYPVYEQNNKLKDLAKISFYAYLRKREGIQKPAPGHEEEYEEALKKWKIDENGKWNFADISHLGDFKGDLIGFAGFKDDDIYYQKKKVGMSFLRLSFYDTKDRLTQSLLGYSTLFLDTTELYKKYVLKKNKNLSDNYLIFNDSSPRLNISFSCGNKYTYDKSSEGFYIYLFPSLLETQPKEGGYNIIYMKAEFNNAKYGKTVPFIMPTRNGAPVPPPDDYEKTDSGKTYIDMQQLFDDMYIRIGIKYDDDKKRYIWRFMDISNTAEEIEINLYEPRVNNTDE